MTIAAEIEDLHCSSLTPGCVLDIETRTRHYHMEFVGDDKFRISGHPLYCPDAVLAEIQGSVTRQGEFMPAVIGCGMRLLFVGLGDKVVATSEVTAIRMEGAAGSN
jgi:hypothetical protein